jgi:hypothetical protein
MAALKKQTGRAAAQLAALLTFEAFIYGKT